MAQMSALIAFNPNTTILSADTNSNNTTIRSTYNAHDVATTAVHGVSTGTLAYWLSSGDFGVNATNKLFLDGRAGGGDTYITEASANTIRIIANTRMIGQFFGGAAVTDDYFSIQATSKLYFDGGSDTYEVESSANVHDTVVGGTIAHRINSAGETLMPAVDPPTANYANRNSFVKAWGYFTSAGATDAAYNCSCTYSGAAATGYTVTWNTDFSSVNYAAVAQIKGVAGFARIQTQFAGTATVILYDASGVAITSQFSIMAAGGQ